MSLGLLLQWKGIAAGISLHTCSVVGVLWRSTSTYHLFIYPAEWTRMGNPFFLEVSTPCRKQISTLNCATGTLASKKVDVAVMPVALEGQGLQGGHATYTRDRGQPADLTHPDSSQLFHPCHTPTPFFQSPLQSEWRIPGPPGPRTHNVTTL